MSTSISDTPGEILERILDFLHDDHPSLCSCCLVSREWLSAARYHLVNPTIINEFQRPDRRYKDNLHSFLALVQSPNSTILFPIRKVVLNIATLDLIKPVVDELRHSKSLNHVVFLDHSYLRDSPSLSWMAQAFPSVRNFSYSTIFAVRDEAYRLFASLPRLQDLAIYTEVYTNFMFPAQIPGPHFFHISTLRLRLLKSEQFLDWLQTLDCWNSLLETLDLRIFRVLHRGWGPVKALNAFLRANSGTLRQLSLGIDYAPSVVDVDESYSVDNEEEPIDLSSLSNLRTVFFRTHDINSISNSLMTLLPSSRLDVLSIHVLKWDYNPCDCVPSHLLERLARIMEDVNAFGGTALNFRLSKIFGGSDLDFIRRLFGKGELGGGLKLSPVDFDEDEDYQVDSYQAMCETLIA
ncbi:hypothetical protein GALMADRAFT_162306 [Galerina marginata CBS 339.88]|uniref:Uncharacterized protein n=1 Tax=Galerina marginata (strain CBS 339.88) TaxID=685588 RepID=A0A067SDR9_GALM3|nr:hypothetical protein GALMADRAFT_162306 [Galerina marginata CBS 339.88]